MGREGGEVVVVTKAGDVLDALCCKHYGFIAGALEAVLAANPRERIQAVYPAGVELRFPAVASPRAQQETTRRRLWE